MNTNTYDIAERLMEKEEKRLNVGWIDWSTDSWDRRMAMRRAYRIACRIHGIRTDKRTGLPIEELK